MPTYGLGPSGFTVKPIDQILSDIEQAELSGISQSLDLQPTSPLGVLNGIVAQAASDVWQLGLALYDGMDPDEATGDQLDGLGLITGTVRTQATKTIVYGCTVNVAAGSYAIGSLVASVVGTNNTVLFTNLQAINNGFGTNHNFTVDFEATVAGATQCLAGTLTVIAQPVTGWNSITNPNDGIVGSPTETDADLRLRRVQELEANGSATADAIRSAVLLQMQPPTTSTATTACTVLFNNTDSVDANNLTPHSIEVIAQALSPTAADNTALATLILNEKAAGIATNGTNNTTVIDAQGNSQVIYYTRPTVVDLYCTITVLTDPTVFPSNGAALVAQAMANYANGGGGFTGEYQPGVDVYVQALKSSVFVNPYVPNTGVPGVLDITAFKVDTIPVPVNTANIPISIRQIARLLTGNITVTVT